MKPVEEVIPPLLLRLVLRRLLLLFRRVLVFVRRLLLLLRRVLVFVRREPEFKPMPLLILLLRTRLLVLLLGFRRS